jgi:hypothetical protein
MERCEYLDFFDENQNYSPWESFTPRGSLDLEFNIFAAGKICGESISHQNIALQGSKRADNCVPHRVSTVLICFMVSRRKRVRNSLFISGLSGTLDTLELVSHRY